MVKSNLYYDNTKMKCFQTCRIKYYYRHILGLVPNMDKNALRFGKAIHTGLSIWYETGDADKALHEAFKDYEDDLTDEKRTSARGKEILSEYFLQYPTEPFDIIANEIPVEILISSDPYNNYILTGKIDLVCKWHGGIYGIDHKTTSRLGDYYFTQYEISRQMLGYTWALKQLYSAKDSAVQGMLINALAVYKNKFKFERQPLTYSQTKLQWYETYIPRLMKKIRGFENKVNIKEGENPRDYILPNWNSCNNYGRCVYKEVCKSSRPEYVIEQNFKQEFWDPRDEFLDKKEAKDEG